jgi:hypothetical protein
MFLHPTMRDERGGGLYLQVSKWRTKAWLFRFELDGQERQMGLGPLNYGGADNETRAIAGGDFHSFRR